MIYYLGEERPDFQSCSKEFLLEYLWGIPEIGLDIETTRLYPKGMYNEDVYEGGLDPYLSKVVMLQVGDLQNQFIIDARKVDVTFLRDVLTDPGKLIVGSNLKFEAKHLRHNYDFVFRNVWDCMLCEQVLTNGLQLRVSLAHMANRYLGIPLAEEKNLFTEESEDDVIDKSTRNEFVTIGDKPFTREQIMYGKDDIIYPLKIRQLQLRNEYQPTEAFEIENNFCLVLADIELKGMEFDSEQWLKTAGENQVVYDRRLKKLNDYIIANFSAFCTAPDLFNSEARCNILWSSPDQVIAYLKHLGICPKEKSKQTKKLEYTAGAKALSKLLNKEYKILLEKGKETEIASNEDFILNYLLMKEAEQSITTFGKDFLKYIHPITGKIHSSYKQLMSTSRLSSTRPNSQNVPNVEKFRKAFVAGKHKSLINSDFSSQESRILAEVTGDEALLSFFNDGDEVFGDDFHSWTATRMYRVIYNDPELVVSKKTHPEERQNAKAIGFKISLISDLLQECSIENWVNC